MNRFVSMIIIIDFSFIKNEIHETKIGKAEQYELLHIGYHWRVEKQFFFFFFFLKIFINEETINLKECT